DDSDHAAPGPVHDPVLHGDGAESGHAGAPEPYRVRTFRLDERDPLSVGAPGGEHAILRARDRRRDTAGHVPDPERHAVARHDTTAVGRPTRAEDGSVLIPEELLIGEHLESGP